MVSGLEATVTFFISPTVSSFRFWEKAVEVVTPRPVNVSVKPMRADFNFVYFIVIQSSSRKESPET